MTRFASIAPTTRAGLLAVGVFAGLAMFAVGASVIALAGLGRLSDAIDPSRVPAWLWYYRADPEVRKWLGVGAGITGLLVLILAIAIAVNIRRPLHGAARWSTLAEHRRHGLLAGKGLLLGQGSGRLLISDGPDHVLLYAPTRTGKGVGIVIPNLLAWPDSVVVLDIKRENFNATAGFRAAAGQKVLLFDPLATDGRTARFNPLGHIDRRGPIVVLDELQRIAGMLFCLSGLMMTVPDSARRFSRIWATHEEGSQTSQDRR